MICWQFKLDLILGAFLIALYLISYIKLFKEKWEKPYFWAIVGLSFPFWIISFCMFLINGYTINP